MGGYAAAHRPVTLFVPLMILRPLQALNKRLGLLLRPEHQPHSSRAPSTNGSPTVGVDLPSAALRPNLQSHVPGRLHSITSLWSAAHWINAAVCITSGAFCVAIFIVNTS